MLITSSAKSIEINKQIFSNIV